MKLTDTQLEIVSRFQIENYGYPPEYLPSSVRKTRQDQLFDSLTKDFEYLSQKSLLLQRINKILILAGIAGSGIGWFLFSWAGVGIVVASFIVTNLAFGAWHSWDMKNRTGWDDEVLRAAHDLITEPLWQMDIRR